MNLDERPTALLTADDLLAAATKKVKALRRKYGIAHPLNRFALRGEVFDGHHADALMDSLDATVFEKPGSPPWRSARWFLLESEMFFEFCALAGMDARKWRRHLRRVFRVV